MYITIKHTGAELPEASSALVEEKLGALRKCIHDDEQAMLACEIEESVSAARAGAKYRVEGNLTVNGKLFRAEAMAETLEGAVDRVRDDLMREVLRSKGRARHYLKRGGAALKNMLRFGE